MEIIYVKGDILLIELFKKMKKSLHGNGCLFTFLKILRYPLNCIKRGRFNKEILNLSSNEDRFTWIYRNNYWGSEESFSGTGSTLHYTENIRKELPLLFKEFSIKKIFDAPCGDFNWMRLLLPEVEIDYIGGDIVKPLIDELNREHAANNISFLHFDLIKQIPPRVDLMICRDCLFHFSYENTRSVLENFLKSETKYLLTTTHVNKINGFINSDISTGDFRLMDLFSSPYNFPRNPLHAIEDWLPPDPERQMCLWSREQIAVALSSFQIQEPPQ